MALRERETRRPEEPFDELAELINEIEHSPDGRTEQQRFYTSDVEPRIEWAAQLALWDLCERNIVRGEE